MADESSTSFVAVIADTASAVEHQNQTNKDRRAFGWIKLGCTVASTICFGLGIRAAIQQARPMKSSEISRPQLFSGIGFASRTLLIASMITVSGYTLFIIGISAALKVSSPKEFGGRMKECFGDIYRLKGSERRQEFKDVFKDS